MFKTIKSRIPSVFKWRVKACLHAPITLISVIDNYCYDAYRFLCASSTLVFKISAVQAQAWIDADVHKLEKGLALAAPRPGFGKGVAERLVRDLTAYVDEIGVDASVKQAVRMLAVYRDFNLKHAINYVNLFEHIEHIIKRVGADKGQVNGVGTVLMDKDKWMADAKIELSGFLKSRRSVRDFSDKAVSIADIEKAVAMAIHTPSVCNRQAVRVHAFTDHNQVQAVLGCQQGNRGFGHGVKCVLMVTVDRQRFFNAAERNQCWIDGGLFSMSLIYALHALGLGSCCLNWSVNRREDQVLRRLTNLRAGDAVIMLIAVGHLKPQFKVAASARKNIAHYLVHGIQKSPT